MLFFPILILSKRDTSPKTQRTFITALLTNEKRTMKTSSREEIACVASVSVRFSARSRHFLFFSSAKIGASANKCVTGEGKGEKETLARKPHDFEKRPFDTFTVG